MKRSILLTVFLCLAFSLSALDVNETFSKKYKTGDKTEYSLRGVMEDYNPENIIYKIVDSGNGTDYDLQIDKFTFRVKKGDKFYTYYMKKGTGDGLQSYIIKYFITEEITSVSNNNIEISYKCTKIEKYLKGKNLKSDYELVDKFPWD